ncbi:MAG: PCMD domain-containing protein [Phocaeicola sp.]|uniref:PCMD domain-containing protein n=1 Tax=Phocaeicola TaxID=909656 RepID=UPI00234F0452|nr:PCMD domain-containing protein [Phocaeicola oris]MCE2616163.1 PCMD domain-containing protein [Phocaeicola oris]
MNRKILFLLLIAGLFSTACIREEALNAEADITACTVNGATVLTTDIDYYRTFDESLNAYPIYIEVDNHTNLSALAPVFELTPGAAISPESGTTHNFNTPVRYTVTSEDGNWHRTYALIIRHQQTKSIPTTYHFETADTQNKYHILYEKADGYTTLTWASGNQGFALTGGGNRPSDFPTFLSDEGRSGNCVKLITRSTGSLGQMVNKPIAAGNLFMGKFNMINALTDALNATNFGTTFYYKPLTLSGYYKYKAGEKFYDKGKYTDRKDNFELYAIFFEQTDSVKYMDGHLAVNNFQHSQMVALARVTDRKESNEWVHFSIPFDYNSYGKVVDADKLRNGQYSIAVIMSSSQEGDRFRGAPGSTLMVDDLEITYEHLTNY